MVILMSGLRNQTVIACESCKFVLTVEGKGTITIINNKNKSTYSANGGKLTSLFAAGTEIEISAEAADDWSFKGWEGSISSTENPFVIQVEKDLELKAVFAKKE
jgi:hypothetical protein